VLQCVAVVVLQCVAVVVLQCVAVIVLQCIAVIVLQCVAVVVLQCVAVYDTSHIQFRSNVILCASRVDTVCCSVLQCVAVGCNVLQFAIYSVQK